MRRYLLAAALALAPAGCAQSTHEDIDAFKSASVVDGSTGGLRMVSRLPPPANTNQGADELIAENDLLDIDVFRVDDLDRTVRVDVGGNVTLPLVGAVPAAGKTVAAFELDLKKAYGAKYLQNPEITVFMKQSAGQQITVDGVVHKPGLYAVNSSTTLLQVIAEAGGFQDIADESKVYVFRQIGPSRLVANYDVKSIRAGKIADPRIFGGDVVVSFSSDAKIAMKNLREALGVATSAVRLGPL
jgi:polysaccharide export outer membrane protein